jgi:hypothetical protein
MLCDYCHGKRLSIVGGKIELCSECGGLGVIHCCEGLQAQPEPAQPVTEEPAGQAVLGTVAATAE